MNEDIKKEIIKTREELEKKLNGIKDISELVGKNIDREYPQDFNELSETELDAEMGKRVVFLNENLNIINKINQKTSNKIVKLLLFLPYSIHFMLTKPVLLMKNYLQLNHVLLVRLKRMTERLDRIETRLEDLEGMQELLTRDGHNNR
ncbi:MAG: hypothetical protein KAS65_05900 [Candidatus Aminicenantes bacterium]|nr:hypothetical protein [Candidatus Aminicenantes bacterium]